MNSGIDIPQSSSEIDLDVIDVVLPCRKFAIRYKVAEVGKVALTSEFLLRLVHNVEGIGEADAAAFFGFTESEMGYVVDDVASAGYIERRNGRLYLSIAGRNLFPLNSDVPEIYEVSSRSEDHIFDVIALAPARAKSLTAFEHALPELPVPVGKMTELSRLMRDSFKKHFDEVGRRGNDLSLRQSLYSVDDVASVDRANTTATIIVKGKRDTPGMVEPDLSREWSPYQLDDRGEIVEASARFLRGIEVKRNARDQDLFTILGDLAPNFMAEFRRAGELRRATLYREAARRVGLLRSNQRTVLVVGSLLTDANFKRILRALRYSAREDLEVEDEDADNSDESEALSGEDLLQEDSAETPAEKETIDSAFFWHTPHLQLWGATNRLTSAINSLAKASGKDGVPSTAVCIGIAPVAQHVKRAFNHVVVSHSVPLGLTRLEVLLIPRRVAAVIAHTPFDDESYPIPLGFLSFDSPIVRATTRLVKDLLEPVEVLQSSMPEEVQRAAVASLH